MGQGHKAVHHPLISIGQVLQHLRGFFSLLFHVVRQNSGEVFGGILLPLPVCRIRFHTQKLVLNFPHRFVCGNRQDVNGEHETAIHIAELGDHGILDVAGVSLQVKHPAPAVVQAEVVFLKFHRIRTQPILETVSFFHLLF